MPTMRPETGKTNSPEPNDKMSIRLRSDGHSFPEFPNGACPGTIELTGRKTVLVPAEAFRPDRAETFLAWSGLACDASERAVWSAEREGRVAVMAIARELFDRLPREVRFSSPLLRMEERPRSLVLERHGDLLYVKLSKESGLTLAEVVRIGEDADVLYCAAELSRICPLKRLTLRLSGPEAAALRKNRMLQSQFERVVCE